MMTAQALRIHKEIINTKNVICVVSEKSTFIFTILFPDWRIINYSDSLFYYLQNKFFNFTIDFRSDEVSTKFHPIISCNYLIYFNFEFERRIAYRAKDGDVIYTDAIKIKDHFNDVGTEFSAWKMDAELISKYYYTTQNITTSYEYGLLISEENRLFTDFIKYKYGIVNEIIIFPCGSNNLKHWPIENWNKLIIKLINLNIPVKIFLGPEEINLYDYFNSITTTYLNCSWADIISHFHNKSLVVSNDCGPMHVAGILGCSLVGIFGTTNEKVWFTYNSTGICIKESNQIWPDVDKVLSLLLIEYRK